MDDTYTTLAKHKIDLTPLTGEERAFLKRAVAAYYAGVDWTTFCQSNNSLANPLLRATEGWVTQVVAAHPLFQALQDLEDRIAIREGAPVDPDQDPDLDPFAAVSTLAEQTTTTS
jgi:hypothetical protein